MAASLPAGRSAVHRHSGGVRRRAGDEGLEFSGGSIGLHLAIPIVIGPAAQLGRNLGAFFNRQFLDCRSDDLNRTHSPEHASRPNLGKGLFSIHREHPR